MGYLGRALGDFGSQLGEATDIRQKWAQNLLQQQMQQAKLAQDQMAFPLQLQDLKNKISQFPLEQQDLKNRVGLEGWQRYTVKRSDGGEDEHYYNPLTKEDRVIASGAAPATKYSDVRIDTSGQMWGLNDTTGKWDKMNEGTKYPVPGEGTEDRPVTVVFGGYRWKYDPGGKIPGTRQGQWVRLGVAKEVGEGSAPSTVDALIGDIVGGRAKLPTGKLGAQVSARAKQLGIQLPELDLQSNIKSAVSAAQKAYTNYKTLATSSQQMRKTEHFWDHGSSQGEQIMADQAKAQYEAARQDAVAAYTAAGLPVPTALSKPIDGGGSDPTSLPGVSPAQ